MKKYWYCKFHTLWKASSPKRHPVQDTGELYTQFKTQDLENHTFSSGTYPYRPNKGVPPRENKVSQWTLFDEIASQDVSFGNKLFQVYNKYSIHAF